MNKLLIFAPLAMFYTFISKGGVKGWKILLKKILQKKNLKKIKFRETIKKIIFTNYCHKKIKN
jgi:hypothetical protein